MLDSKAFTDWAEVWHDDLLTIKPPEINKTAVKALLKTGEELPGVKLAESQNIQIK